MIEAGGTAAISEVGCSGFSDALVVVILGVFTEYFVIATSFPGVARLLPIMGV